MVCEVLPASLEPQPFDDRFEPVIDPAASLSAVGAPQAMPIEPPIYMGHNVLDVALAHQRIDLVLVGAEDVLIAAAKVRVYLPGQQGVFRDVGPPRVVVQREQKEPDDADEDAEKRQVGRQLEHTRVAS